MTYNVLAFDLATTSGWATWKPGMARPFFGALRLPANPEEVGRPIEELRKTIDGLHKMYGPFTDFVFEAQHATDRVNMHVLYRLIGLGAHVEWVAYRMGGRCFKIHIQTWRKHFIGKGTGFTTAEFKQKAIARCEELGWFTDQSDAAEACGILDYYLHQLAKADKTLVLPWRDKALFKQPGLSL